MRWAAPLLALLVVAAPAASGAAEARLGSVLIRFDLPDGFAPMPEPGGLRLGEDGGRRAPREMILRPALGEPPLPLDRLIRLDGRAARYGTDRAEGGSGGAEFRLVVDLRCGDAALRLHMHVQSEHGPPDFAPAWSVLRSLRCRDAGG